METYREQVADRVGDKSTTKGLNRERSGFFAQARDVFNSEL